MKIAFQSTAHHRDLHSFPTRRSSDLADPPPKSPVPQAIAEARPKRTTDEPAPNGSARSEEHTSELQSPVHLVCRRLLEKKKETILVRRERRHRCTCVVSDVRRDTQGY